MPGKKPENKLDLVSNSRKVSLKSQRYMYTCTEVFPPADRLEETVSRTHLE